LTCLIEEKYQDFRVSFLCNFSHKIKRNNTIYILKMSNHQTINKSSAWIICNFWERTSCAWGRDLPSRRKKSSSREEFWLAIYYCRFFYSCYCLFFLFFTVKTEHTCFFLHSLGTQKNKMRRDWKKERIVTTKTAVYFTKLFLLVMNCTFFLFTCIKPVFIQYLLSTEVTIEDKLFLLPPVTDRSILLEYKNMSPFDFQNR
jgi:hypothetical protein